MRTYAKVYVSIWADEDFKALTPHAQALYFRLLTDPKLSMCGVADWRPNRLALCSEGSTAETIREAADELEANRFIVTDDDSEEVLVRSFVRHDGVLKSPNLVKAMLADWTATTSAAIKNVIVDEVARTAEAEPDAKGSREVPSWFVKSDTEPTGKGSGSVPDQFPGPSPILHPSSSILHPVGGRTGKASQLPRGWVPSEANINYAKENGIDLAHEADQFRSHHLAKGSTYKNWDQAFRTWLGNAKKWGKPVPVAAVPPADPYAFLRTPPPEDPDSLPWLQGGKS